MTGQFFVDKSWRRVPGRLNCGRSTAVSALRASFPENRISLACCGRQRPESRRQVAEEGEESRGVSQVRGLLHRPFHIFPEQAGGHEMRVPHGREPVLPVGEAGAARGLLGLPAGSPLLRRRLRGGAHHHGGAGEKSPGQLESGGTL